MILLRLSVRTSTWDLGRWNLHWHGLALTIAVRKVNIDHIVHLNKGNVVMNPRCIRANLDLRAQSEPELSLLPHTFLIHTS